MEEAGFEPLLCILNEILQDVFSKTPICQSASGWLFLKLATVLFIRNLSFFLPVFEIMKLEGVGFSW